MAAAGYGLLPFFFWTPEVLRMRRRISVSQPAK